MKALNSISLILVLTILHFTSNGQIKLDGLYGLKYDKEYYSPVIFLKFNKDTFEFTDYRGEIKYGKGNWDFESFKLRLKYVDLPYQQSFVTSFSDSPKKKSNWINLNAFVYDGFSKMSAFKPTISLYDHSDKEIIEIKGDTSGKVISIIKTPQLFKKLRLNVNSEYSDPPEVDLSKFFGHNLYLHFFINLNEKNLIKKSVQIYKFRRSPMGDMILTDENGKDLIFEEYGWRYGL